MSKRTLSEHIPRGNRKVESTLPGRSPAFGGYRRLACRTARERRLPDDRADECGCRLPRSAQHPGVRSRDVLLDVPDQAGRDAMTSRSAPTSRACCAAADDIVEHVEKKLRHQAGRKHRRWPDLSQERRGVSCRLLRRADDDGQPPLSREPDECEQVDAILDGLE